MKRCCLIAFIFALFLNGCTCPNCIDNSKDTDCSCKGPDKTCVCSSPSPTREGLSCSNTSINSIGLIVDSVSICF